MDKETKEKFIDGTIGSAEHEGFKDDGYTKQILTRLANHDITEEEANKLLDQHYAK